MIRQWSQRTSLSDFLEGEEKLPPLVVEILKKRMSASSDLKNILEAQLDSLADPMTIVDMDKAVDRLEKAFDQQEHLCIYADFDLDGTSGLALLQKALVDLGFSKVSYYQPRRLTEGYGFHAHAVEEIQARGVSLLITVDVGITAFAACQKSEEIGLDVMITDHHQASPTEGLPKALAIVNPNRKDDTSGLGYLSGVGVAFYLARALKKRLVQKNKIDSKSMDLKSLLDVFTIGTVTDMVPMIKDNRLLVKHGLVELEKTKRMGLIHLMKQLKLQGRPLTAQDVGIRLAPKLNALSRLESSHLPVEIFLETDPDRAHQMALDILKVHEHRVELQSVAEKKAQQELQHLKNPPFVAIYSKDFHKGVIGLVATKLSSQFQCPAFVGSLNEQGKIAGSARIPFDRWGNILEYFPASEMNILERSGGHPAAAGFELKEQNWDLFFQFLTDRFQSSVVGHSGEPTVLESFYDVEVQAHDLQKSLMKWLDFLGPWGQGFVQPVFLLRNCQLREPRELRGGHLKAKVHGQEMEVLMFSPRSKDESLQLMQGPVDLLGELQWNHFGGKSNLQMLLKDMRTAQGVEG